MQTYDLLMLLVLVATTVFGFWKGMAWQIASLASLGVSYVASLKFSEQLAPVFGDHAPWNRFVAMLAIYMGTSFLIWTMFRFISGAIDKVRLQSFDKQIGAMFGFAKGVLLCIAVTFFAVTLLPPAQGDMIVGSQSGHYIVALLDKAHSVFPPELHQVLDPYLNKVEQRLNPNFQPHAEGLQQMWPSQAKTSAPAGFPQINLPKMQLPQIQWPQATAPQQPQSGWPMGSQPQSSFPATTPTQFGWPTGSTSEPSTAATRDPYSMPR
jgi:membrane protein required for colicin V production